MGEDKIAFKYEDPYKDVDIPATPVKELYAMKSEGNELVSMKGSQEGLKFTTTRAVYDMRNYELLLRVCALLRLPMPRCSRIRG